MRRPTKDLPLILLRHATENANRDVRLRFLDPLDSPEGAVDLVLGMLTDRAGIIKDRVGLADIVGQLVAFVVAAFPTTSSLSRTFILNSRASRIRKAFPVRVSGPTWSLWALDVERRVGGRGRSSVRESLLLYPFDFWNDCTSPAPRWWEPREPQEPFDPGRPCLASGASPSSYFRFFVSCSSSLRARTGQERLAKQQIGVAGE